MNERFQKLQKASRLIDQSAHLIELGEFAVAREMSAAARDLIDHVATDTTVTLPTSRPAVCLGGWESRHD